MTDKEIIRAEIERRIEMYRDTEHRIDPNRVDEDECLLAFIDSLPEEPAQKGYDEAYLNECIAKASKTWEGVDVDKYMDEVRGRESDDLEEAANKYADGEDPKKTIRKSAQWKKLE